MTNLGVAKAMIRAASGKAFPEGALSTMDPKDQGPSVAARHLPMTEAVMGRGRRIGIAARSVLPLSIAASAMGRCRTATEGRSNPVALFS